MTDYSNNPWVRVSKEQPCVVCGKGDWCVVAPDGNAAICMRTESDRLVDCGGAGTGWLHRLNGRPDARSYEHPGHRRGQKSKPLEWQADVARYAANGAEKRHELARALGVSPDSLELLEVGWDGEAWTFPERDSAGRVIGIARRFRDGRKAAVSGSKRGLTFVVGWDILAGPVVVVEGGTDTAAGITLGLATIGRPSNTGGVKLLAALLRDVPRYRQIFILGEGDRKAHDDLKDELRERHNPNCAGCALCWPGRYGAMHIAEQLARKLNRPVAWALPPDGAKDLRAWLQTNGRDQQRFLDSLKIRTVEPPPTAGPVLVNLADVQPEAVRWLWPGRIPLGKVTLLVGDPGLGKSLISLDVAARVSTGHPWPDGSANETGSVMILSAEDDLGDTVRPRLDAAGADVTRIDALDTVRVVDPETGESVLLPFNLRRDLPVLKQAIESRPGCRLVIIDPIGAFLGGTDSHKDADIRALLHPLSDLATRYNVAILAIMHPNKASTMPAMYRVSGSLGFVAAARAAWVVVKDKGDATGRRRLFLPLKNNLGDDDTGLAYSIVERPGSIAPCVAWEAEPVNISVDEAIGSEVRRRGPQAEAQSEAQDWLRDVLRDGPRPAKEIKKQAGEDGITRRTLDRAKSELNVKSFREGFGEGGRWLWALLDDEDALHSAPKDTTPENLAHNGKPGALYVNPEENSGFSRAEERQSTIDHQVSESGDEWGQV